MHHKAELSVFFNDRLLTVVPLDLTAEESREHAPGDDGSTAASSPAAAPLKLLLHIDGDTSGVMAFKEQPETIEISIRLPGNSASAGGELIFQNKRCTTLYGGFCTHPTTTTTCIYDADGERIDPKSGESDAPQIVDE